MNDDRNPEVGVGYLLAGRQENMTPLRENSDQFGLALAGARLLRLLSARNTKWAKEDQLLQSCGVNSVLSPFLSLQV